MANSLFVRANSAFLVACRKPSSSPFVNQLLIQCSKSPIMKYRLLMGFMSLTVFLSLYPLVTLFMFEIHINKKNDYRWSSTLNNVSIPRSNLKMSLEYSSKNVQMTTSTALIWSKTNIVNKSWKWIVKSHNFKKLKEDYIKNIYIPLCLQHTR